MRLSTSSSTLRVAEGGCDLLNTFRFDNTFSGKVLSLRGDSVASPMPLGEVMPVLLVAPLVPATRMLKGPLVGAEDAPPPDLLTGEVAAGE